MTDVMIEKIVGKAVPIYEDDVDTDRIMPARYLKEITFEHMGEYLFYDVRFDQNGNKKGFVLDLPEYKNANIIIAGKNFGCGSSREHAPQGIKRFGIKAIIAESFAEIFAGNCQALGIPTLTVSKQDIEKLVKISSEKPETNFEIDINTQKVNYENNSIAFEIPISRKQAFLDGTWDVSYLLKANMDKIEKKAKDLAYINNFE